MTKRVISTAATVLATCLLAAATSCGGTAGTDAPQHQGAIAPVQLVSTHSLKVTSGPPAGIFVTWTRSTDPRATGYYLYRDTQHIPDPPPDETLPPALRTNDGLVIPQPASGATVTFNDLFTVLVGQEYFYRVTVLNNDDPPQESYPSNEMSWVVHGHNVGSVTPDTAYWGDDVTVDGDTFGTYNETTDMVRFTSMDGTTVEGAVVSWEDTSITATVPDGADTGPVYIVIDGTPAQTDNDLTILSPMIYSLDPAVGFLEQPLSIIGKNFGETRLNSKVYLGGVDITFDVTDWSDTQIDLTVPVDTGDGDVYVVVQGRETNHLTFTPRPEIFDASPPIQTGEVVTLSGRLFGDDEGVVLLDSSVPMTVVSWSADTVEATLVGDAGPHTITIQDASGLLSNDFDYTLIPELTVTLSGLFPGVIYDLDNPPAIGVDAPDDAEKVELLIDGEVFQFSTVPPFDGMTLPVSKMTNGTHVVMLKAYRRTITAESEPISATVYSLVGDVNGDGMVDNGDRNALEGLIGMHSDDPLFEPWYDTDGDNDVTEADLSAVGYNFGDQITGP